MNTTITTLATAAAYLNGRNAYLNGDHRVYPVQHPLDGGSEASNAWAKEAAAWYRGFDAAMLAA